MKQRTHSEDDFTIPKLLIVISITRIIFNAISMTLVLNFRTTDDTMSRLTSSHDRQLLTSYLTTDAQSAKSVTHNAKSGAYPEGILELV